VKKRLKKLKVLRNNKVIGNKKTIKREDEG
jgi:hypothetical protein